MRACTGASSRRADHVAIAGRCPLGRPVLSWRSSHCVRTRSTSDSSLDPCPDPGAAHRSRLLARLSLRRSGSAGSLPRNHTRSLPSSPLRPRLPHISLGPGRRSLAHASGQLQVSSRLSPPRPSRALPRPCSADRRRQHADRSAPDVHPCSLSLSRVVVRAAKDTCRPCRARSPPARSPCSSPPLSSSPPANSHPLFYPYAQPPLPHPP